jgi:glucosamine 6-phosphate synthetase-like amidotransferase/phosphosugar isomerase protein
VSETDTECIAKLTKYIFDQKMKVGAAMALLMAPSVRGLACFPTALERPSFLVRPLQANIKMTFRDLIEEVVRGLEGAFAIIVKSTHYPNEVGRRV